MRKKILFVICVLSIICFVVFYIIYTRPFTIEQRYPYFNISECAEISGEYYVHKLPDSSQDIEFNISPNNAQFSELIEIIQSAKLKKSILKQETTHRLEVGDFMWSLTLCFDEDSLNIYNFYGNLSIRHNLKEIKCTVDEQEKWIKDIMDIILQHMEE